MFVCLFVSWDPRRKAGVGIGGSSVSITLILAGEITYAVGNAGCALGYGDLRSRVQGGSGNGNRVGHDGGPSRDDAGGHVGAGSRLCCFLLAKLFLFVIPLFCQLQARVFGDARGKKELEGKIYAVGHLRRALGHSIKGRRVQSGSAGGDGVRGDGVKGCLGRGAADRAGGDIDVGLDGGIGLGRRRAVDDGRGAARYGVRVDLGHGRRGQDLAGGT